MRRMSYVKGSLVSLPERNCVLCGRGSLKITLEILNRNMVTVLHYMRLSYISSLPTCCINTFSLSVNSMTCFSLPYWPLSQVEHVRELTDYEKVFVQQLGIELL